MTSTYQFELVEEPAPTSSGFVLRVHVARWTSPEDGEISISPGCATFGEFDAQISRLIDGLERIRTEGETRFADGHFGPRSLNLR